MTGSAVLALVACAPAVELSDPPAPEPAETCHETVSLPDPVELATPCPDQMTPDLVASLQRALKVRGFYEGRVDGKLGPGTRAAILRYQTARGVPTEVLALPSAKALGLVAYSRAELLAAG